MESVSNIQKFYTAAKTFKKLKNLTVSPSLFFNKKYKVFTAADSAIMAAANAGRQGLGALLKRGWNEIPEVIGSSVMAVIGIGLGITGLKLYKDNDGDNRPYKHSYTVYRPDDPRAAKIRKDI